MIIYRKLYRFVVSALVLSIILSGVICIPAVAQVNTLNKVYCTATLEDEFDDNKVIIVIHPQYNNRAYGISDFNEINCIEIKDRSVNVKEGKPSRILTLTLAVNSNENVLAAIQILERRNDIYSAEPSYTMSPCTIPNDEKYVSGKQWAINKISLPDAWGETTGSSEVLVGVIDSGIDGTHPDLANRINTELSQGFNDYSSNPLIDNLGHGTAVAGIIGAEGDNTEGIAGVCWNVQLISLRVAKSDGNFDGDAILAAIQYAELHNIPILNYSGGSSANSFRTAIETYSGVFVCAAGNEKQNNDETAHYPSNNNDLPNVISVGASTEEDTKRSSSNYGATKVDLFAPGEDILTTVIGSRKYAESGGTSIAAPYVTGVAALLLSKIPIFSPAKSKLSLSTTTTMSVHFQANVLAAVA